MMFTSTLYNFDAHRRTLIHFYLAQLQPVGGENGAFYIYGEGGFTHL